MPDVHTAELVLPGAPIDRTVAFFRELGFRLDEIGPADAPRAAVLSGFGTRLRLDADMAATATTLRLVGHGLAHLHDRTAPNGTRLVVAAPPGPVRVPPPSGGAVVQRRGDGDADEAWAVGRAGMRYRDLIPGRLGGFLIGSHIRIPDGGPVADDVHFHDVAFQLIFCAAGRVRLVYEDQGPPFWLEAGGCVLQPPGIRHRVLECAPGLEVVELACPAEHRTRLDHDLALPTAALRPERRFGGQRFHEYGRDGDVAGEGTYDLGLDDPTGGLASARILVGADVDRASARAERAVFTFVLAGSCRVRLPQDDAIELSAGDAVTIPPRVEFGVERATPDTRVLSVRLAPPG